MATAHMFQQAKANGGAFGRMTPPLAVRWAVALLDLPRIVAGIALDAIDRRVCRLSNDLGGDD